MPQLNERRQLDSNAVNSGSDNYITPATDLPHNPIQPPSDYWQRYFGKTLQKLYEDTRDTLGEIISMEQGVDETHATLVYDQSVKTKLSAYLQKIIEMFDESRAYTCRIWKETIVESDDVLDLITAIYVINSMLMGDSLQELLDLTRAAFKETEAGKDQLIRETSNIAKRLIHPRQR